MNKFKIMFFAGLGAAGVGLVLFIIGLINRFSLEGQVRAALGQHPGLVLIIIGAILIVGGIVCAVLGKKKAN